MSIEERVDRIIYPKKRSRSYGRKAKLVMSILGSVFVGALLVGATLFSTFVDQTHDITVESYLFWDGDPMGDLIVTDSLSGYGGETISIEHNISYIATDNGDIPLDFDFSGDALTDGTITASIWYNDTEITNLTVSPDNLYTVTVKYYIHPYAVPNTYNITLTVSLGA